MNYNKIIKDAQAQNALTQATAEHEAQKEQAAKHQAIADTKRLFTSIIITELEKARLALKDLGHYAETGNGDTQHGQRRSLHLNSHTLVFQAITEGELFRPEIKHYTEHKSHTPKNPLQHSTQLGIGGKITLQQVQQTISTFIETAL